MFRRPRAFISYSHEDADLRDNLATWLSRQGVTPVFDREVRFGDGLSLKLLHLIDNSDCLIALGTSHGLKSEKSEWVRQETQYARHRNKLYFPILFDSVPEPEIPDWFTGRDIPGLGEIKYVTCRSGDGWTSLEPLVRQLRQGGINLRTGVLMVFVLLFVVPAFLLLLVRPRIGLPSGEVRRIQEATEAMNARIEAARKGVNHELVRVGGDDNLSETWVDSSTGKPVAKDNFDSSDPTLVRKRYFFVDGRELAMDSIRVMKSSDGSESLLKTREIYPSGNEVVIEDTFDSIGKLVSKRVRTGKNGPWHNYVELASSIYPAILAAYR